MPRIAQRGFITLVQLAIYAGIFLAVAGVIGGAIYKVKKWGADEVRMEWADAVEDQRQREIMASVTAAKALADERKKRKVVIEERTQYVDKIVEMPVYAAHCLDAVGLRCIESAINRKGAAGCKPDRTVPPDPAPDRDNRRGGPALGLILDRTIPGLRGG